jgi:hypothetical protein
MVMTDAEFTAFSDSCQHACKSLPDGWRVSIQLENCSGWVDLFNPEGDLRDTGPVDCDESIPECVRRLVKAATEYAGTR